MNVKASLCFFICLFFGHSVAAQDANNSTDLAAQLAQAKDADAKMRLLEALMQLSLASNLEEAKKYAQQAQQLALEEGSADLQRKANLMMGIAYVELTQYDSAELYLDLVLQQPKGAPSQRAEAHYRKGFMAGNSRAFSTAAENYFQAIDYWTENGDQRNIARAYFGITDLYAMQSEYNKAIEYGEKAVAILEALGDKKLLAKGAIELSYTYTLQGQQEEALRYISQAIDLYEALGNEDKELARALNGRGNAYKHLGRYEEAVVDYERCRSVSQNSNFIRGVVASTGNIGHTLLLQGKYAEALPNTLAAIEIMTGAGDLRNLEENLMHTSAIYAGLGDFEKAHQYKEQQLQEVKRQQEERVALLEQGLAEKYEAGQKAATIVLQQQQIQQQGFIQLLLIGSAILLTALLLLIYRGLRNKQKSNQLLAKTNALLEKKNQENELLLKEIHHRVKNNLEVVSSLLALQGAHIEDPNVLDAITESQNRVHSMGIIHQRLYQGENLAAIEMKDYFVHLSEGILDSFGAEGRIQIECAMEELELDVDTAVPIGLIVNELLTNALKYAFPQQRNGRISISLREDAAQTLYLEIADNGVGKEGIAPKGTGFGTQLIQLLTRQLSGQLTEKVENGTVVSLAFRKNQVA